MNIPDFYCWLDGIEARKSPILLATGLKGVALWLWNIDVVVSERARHLTCE